MKKQGAESRLQQQRVQRPVQWGLEQGLWSSSAKAGVLGPQRGSRSEGQQAGEHKGLVAHAADPMLLETGNKGWLWAGQ